MSTPQTTSESRRGMYAKLPPRDAVAHALTAYDRAAAKRKSHNRYFIGIALNALATVHDENPDAGFAELLEPFCGRPLRFLIRELGLEDRLEVGPHGELSEVASWPRPTLPRDGRCARPSSASPA